MVKCRKCKKEFPDGAQGGWDNEDKNLTCENCLESDGGDKIEI